jgi:hypothetical protein
MKATGGGSRRRQAGHAGLMIAFVLAGLVIAGVMLAPNLVLKVQARNRQAEERTIVRIGDAFLKTLERTQSIPSPTNWSTAIAPFIAQDRTGTEQVFPGFASDTNITRVFLLDPGLPNGLLPYSQGLLGLTNAQTNLLGGFARAMLVSNTRRGLAMPVTSGVPNSNSFYAVWNWVLDPVTKSPPAGWPSSWSSKGDFLHVRRFNLANQFHRVTYRNLLYGVGDANTPTNLVTSQTTFAFLRGTRLTLAQTNGTLKRIHVVNRDISFDFSNSNSISPIAWWQFSEASGVVATNSGTFGPSADGIFTNGATLGVAGPRPPTYSGYASNNTAISLDGVNDYVKGTNNLLNNVSGFTVGAWINPSGSTMKDIDLFGQHDIVRFGFTTPDGKLELWCDNSTKKLHYFYPYGAGEWHHIVGVGDGAKMYIYVDGVAVAERTFATTTYGSNSNPFNIGGNITSGTEYFLGLIDEVIVYDRALSAAEIALLYQGQVF